MRGLGSRTLPFENVDQTPAIVRQLLDAGLIDELHLFVDPIAVRDGMRLFDETAAPLPLALIGSTAFTTGVLHLVYGPVDTKPAGTYRQASQAMARSAGRQGSSDD